MTATHDWRCVPVPPPAPLAGIGEALRRAFPVSPAMRSLKAFADLLARLRGREKE
jgi:hypothetical protein